MKIAKTTVLTLPNGVSLQPRDKAVSRKRHLFGKEEARWRHATRMPDGTDRDWQRSRAYDCEWLHWPATFDPLDADRTMSWPETLRFIAKLLNSATFQRRWGVQNLRVLEGSGRRRACATRGVVILPANMRRPWIILHEVAHAVCPAWEQHGRLWARTYLELVRLTFGKGSHDAFRDRLRGAGVKFTPRRSGDYQEAKPRARRRRASSYRNPLADFFSF